MEAKHVSAYSHILSDFKGFSFIWLKMILKPAECVCLCSVPPELEYHCTLVLHVMRSLAGEHPNFSLCSEYDLDQLVPQLQSGCLHIYTHVLWLDQWGAAGLWSHAPCELSPSSPPSQPPPSAGAPLSAATVPEAPGASGPAPASGSPVAPAGPGSPTSAAGSTPTAAWGQVPGRETQE